MTSNLREYRNFIGGAFHDGAAGTFDDIDPATGEVAARVHEADRAQVDAAVQAARAALAGPWAALADADRAALLARIADAIDARFDDFLAAEIADTGKPVAQARTLDIPRGAANFRAFAELIKGYPSETYRMDTADGAGAINYVVRKPRGVVGVICPWNLPLLLLTWKVAPALACGNAVVCKPSEETPATATLLGEVMNEVGVPPGVYNVVHGFGPDSAGQFITEHPGIDGITFTGETVTGEAIMKAAAHGVRPVSMELGGKNPGLVFADCDLERAVEGTVRSAFANCGQVCLNTERLYVERPVFAAFVERLAERTRSLRMGPPLDEATTTGPLISRGHRDKVLSYYAAAREGGAEIVVGGDIPEMTGRFSEGAWIEPTIWTGLGDDSPVNREEIFGPCVHISPFDEEDEAIARANDTDYGLAASIWTENLARAHRVAAAIDVGIAWINSWFLRDLRTPFGGNRRSGIGREGGAHAFEFYSETRNVCVKL